MKKLFIRNLSFEAREGHLKELFKDFEGVSVSLPRDRVTGKSRGFAFVEVDNDSDANKNIKDFNNYKVEGREIEIKETTEDRKKTSRRDEDYNER